MHQSQRIQPVEKKVSLTWLLFTTQLRVVLIAAHRLMQVQSESNDDHYAFKKRIRYLYELCQQLLIQRMSMSTLRNPIKENIQRCGGHQHFHRMWLTTCLQMYKAKTRSLQITRVCPAFLIKILYTVLPLVYCSAHQILLCSECQ